MRFLCWLMGHTDVFYFGSSIEEGVIWAKVRCTRCGRESTGIKLPAKSNQSEGQKNNG